MTERYCARCDDELQTPVESHAYYVIADDFVKPEKIEMTYAYFHTIDSRKRLKELMETDHYAGLSSTEIEQNAAMLEDGDEYGIDSELMRVEHITDINTASHDPDFITFFHTQEYVPVQKTGLVCPSCLDADDGIIWGPK